MIDELFLYDRDKGLFKEILKKSTVMQGRYFISQNNGHDLNTSNLDQYFKDPATGLSDIKKYPCVVCVCPDSDVVERNGYDWETFYFHLFFLCTTFKTGNNQIKSIDRDTNSSAHHVWYDWKDMKEAALNFRKMLKGIIRNRRSELPPIDMEFPKTVIKRLTKFNNDSLSGVRASFNLSMAVGECSLTDYSGTAVTDIVIPDFNIHQLHKH